MRLNHLPHVFICSVLLSASCVSLPTREPNALAAEIRLSGTRGTQDTEMYVEFVLTNHSREPVRLALTDTLWLPFGFVLSNERGTQLEILDHFKWADAKIHYHKFKALVLQPGTSHVERIPFHRWMRMWIPHRPPSSVTGFPPGRYRLQGFYQVPFDIRTHAGEEIIATVPAKSFAKGFFRGRIESNVVEFEVTE